MPAYDISLWDFLKYASHIKNEQSGNEEFFPLEDRLEMSLRICDGLLHMNCKKDVAHRDIKLRSVQNQSVKFGSMSEDCKLCFDFSNILLNVHKKGDLNMKWKSGDQNPKSVVITDFGISTSIRVSDYKKSVGTAGWAPPEQWIGKFHVPLVLKLNIL